MTDARIREERRVATGSPTTWRDRRRNAPARASMGTRASCWLATGSVGPAVAQQAPQPEQGRLRHRGRTCSPRPNSADEAEQGRRRRSPIWIEQFRAPQARAAFRREVHPADPRQGARQRSGPQRRRASCAVRTPPCATSGSSWRPISIIWACARAYSTRGRTTMPRASP